MEGPLPGDSVGEARGRQSHRKRRWPRCDYRPYGGAFWEVFDEPTSLSNVRGQPAKLEERPLGHRPLLPKREGVQLQHDHKLGPGQKLGGSSEENQRRTYAKPGERRAGEKYQAALPATRNGALGAGPDRQAQPRPHHLPQEFPVPPEEQPGRCRPRAFRSEGPSLPVL